MGYQLRGEYADPIEVFNVSLVLTFYVGLSYLGVLVYISHAPIAKALSLS